MAETGMRSVARKQFVTSQPDLTALSWQQHVCFLTQLQKLLTFSVKLEESNYIAIKDDHDGPSQPESFGPC